MEDAAFREQCRRQMARPLSVRMKYGFCRVPRPVLDEPGVRVFDSTREYREWCATHLPAKGMEEKSKEFVEAGAEVYTTAQ